jgi:hypothetical protein
MKNIKPSMIVLLLFVLGAIVKNALLYYYGNISIGVALFFMANFIIEGITVIGCYYLIDAIETVAKNNNDFTLAQMQRGQSGN